MSHERDAIARAFSRPFIEPPKRATAKRVGFTLAGVALLAAGLIASERHASAVAHANANDLEAYIDAARAKPSVSQAGASNGVECTTTSTFADSEMTNGQPQKGISGTFQLEFLPGNMARFRFGAGLGTDFTTHMTTTGALYTVGDDPKSYTIIDRTTGELHKELYDQDSKGWTRTVHTGSCHAIHIDSKM